MKKEWASQLMKDWQRDIDMIRDYCSRNLLHQEKRLSNASRISDSERRSIAIASVEKELENILSIPEKWADMPNFYSDFEDYILRIMAVKESMPADKPEPAEEKTEINCRQTADSDLTSKLLKYYKSRGIVGEENLCILQTLCTANKIHFGIEGHSGSGKTFVLDALLELIPQRMIYEIGLSSDNAMFNDLERLNRSEFVYIPELQKAMGRKRGPVVEAIKDLTEGKDAVRVVTLKKGECEEYKIKTGKAVIYTLANENGFKKDVETGRRFIVFHTDNSQEHVKNILSSKAKRRGFQIEERFSQDDFIYLQNHLAECILSNYDFIDPFAEYMIKHIPETSKSGGFVDKYHSLVDAHAKLHYMERVELNGSLIINIEDHQRIHSLYHESFCRNLSSICSDEEQGIIKAAKKKVDWERCLIHGITLVKEKIPYTAEEWISKQRGGKYERT